jgi:hypothetical protein
MPPELEIDDRFFEIIARSETAVLTKHRQSGNLGLWRLAWHSDGPNYPPGFEQNAWAAFLDTHK